MLMLSFLLTVVARALLYVVANKFKRAIKAIHLFETIVTSLPLILVKELTD